MKRTPLARRTPLRRGSSQLRRTGLAPASDKVRARVSARRAAVAAALARDGGCVAAGLVPSVACWGPLDGHEPLTRARGGDPCDPDNVITLCRCHHEFVHRFPDWSYEHGLLRRSS